MVDDHHLEIVTADGHIEVYVTDALRRPVLRAAASFSMTADQEAHAVLPTDRRHRLRSLGRLRGMARKWAVLAIRVPGRSTSQLRRAFQLAP
jgi:hypothetical protein